MSIKRLLTSLKPEQVQRNINIYLEELKNDWKWIETKDFYARYGIKLAFRCETNKLTDYSNDANYDIIFYNEDDPGDYVSVPLDIDYSIDSIIQTGKIVHTELERLYNWLYCIVDGYSYRRYNKDFVILKILSYSLVAWKSRSMFDDNVSYGLDGSIFNNDFYDKIPKGSIFISEITYKFLKQAKEVYIRCDFNQLFNGKDVSKVELYFKSNYLLEDTNYNTNIDRFGVSGLLMVKIDTIISKRLNGSYYLGDEEFENNLKIRLDIANNKPVVNRVIIKKETSELYPESIISLAKW